ncbi:MAG: MFS transporter [Rhodospirillales bacterium]
MAVALLTVSFAHQLGTGLVLALVPMRLAIEGFAAWVAGAMSAAYSVGLLLGCLAAPRLVSRVPGRVAIAVCALVSAASAAALWLFPDPLAWCAARLVAGAFIACLWVVIEAWLGARSTAANRGAVFGSYMLTSRVAFVIPQAALAWADPRIGALFLVAAAAYAVSWLAVLATGDEPPPIHRRAMPGMLEIPRLAPAAAAGALAHGLITTAQPALFPIYGVGLGLGMDRVALGLAAIQFGGMVLQLPLAMASDRWGRRRMMVFAAAATAALSVLAMFAPAGAPALFLVMVAAWGGAPAVLYSLAIAHANDRVQDHQRVAASSTLLLMWGVGATLGPMIASVGMDAFGANMLFVFTAALGAALALFLVWRLLVRRSPAKREPAAAILGAPPDLGR